MIPTYVLVHASAASARSWSAMQRELAFRGHRSLAVDLPGRGAGFSAAYHAQDLETWATERSSLADITAADTIGHVVETVRRVREHGPVILVGHSLGGLAITGAGNEIPDLIDRIVYIAAQCPVERDPKDYLAEYADGELLAATAPVIVGDPMKQGFMRVNWRTTDKARIEALKNALAGPDTTDEGFYGFLGATQPDETLAMWDPGFKRVDKATWGRIPRTYIKLTRDRSCPLPLQEQYIKEADALTPDNRFDVRTAVSSHGGFQIRPAEVADILASLA